MRAVIRFLGKSAVLVAVAVVVVGCCCPLSPIAGTGYGDLGSQLPTQRAEVPLR